MFLQEHYGAPAILMVLVLGIASPFLAKDERFGARISIDLLIGLGGQVILMTTGAVIVTILFGFSGGSLRGRA